MAGPAASPLVPDNESLRDSDDDPWPAVLPQAASVRAVTATVASMRDRSLRTILPRKGGWAGGRGALLPGRGGLLRRLGQRLLRHVEDVLRQPRRSADQLLGHLESRVDDLATGS